jgi:hypothetical protein
MMASQPATIVLSSDEALVLFEWVARFNASGDAKFEDQAEQRALWNLEAMLESVLTEPLKPEYAKLLDAARARLRDKEE